MISGNRADFLKFFPVFVAVKGMERNLKFNLKKNSIVCGDCCNEEGKGWLNDIPDNSINLIYIDPPFFSNKNYEIIWGNGFELRSFGDRFKGGVEHYIKWMKPKIREAKRVLKSTGSIFLHCDYHANHHLKILLDDLLGSNNFLNEIIWYYPNKWPNNCNYFQRNHDTIYWYSKEDKKYTYNKLFIEGMRIKKDIKKGYGSDTYKGVPRIRVYDKEKVDNAIKNGKINTEKYKFFVDQTHKTGKKPMHDVWDINFLNPRSDERIGYDTQKPKNLIKRIIDCASNKNDIVLDFFGGGGTTAEACVDLNRRFIIGDVSPVAVRVTADRLIVAGCSDYEVKALPSTKEEYLQMNPHKFADMICEFMGWESNPRKSGDGNIDGWANKGKAIIQIKNHKNKIGRPEIQKFLGTLVDDYESGIFVAWAFAPSAWEYRAKIKNKDITFIEVEEILGSLLLPISKRVKQQQLYKERVKKSFKESTKAKESELQKEKKEIQKEKRNKIKKRRKSRSNDS